MLKNRSLMFRIAFLLVAGSCFPSVTMSDDAPTASKIVAIEVSISVTDPGEDRNASKIEDRFQLTTLENNKAMVQLGQQVAVITGTQSFGGRGTASRMEQQQTGTIVQAEPRISDAGIVIQLTVEKSWLEFPETWPEDSGESRQITRPTTYTAQLQTTLLLQSGQAETITAMVSGGDGSREATIRVSASTGDDRGTRVTGRHDQHQPDAKPSRGSQADVRSHAGSGNSDSGRAESSSRSRSRGSAPPESDVENHRDDPALVTARRLFDQFDGNRDGVLSDEERVPLERMLNILGFDSSDRVTVETLQQKLRNRIGQRRTSTSPADTDRRRDRDQQDDAEDLNRERSESEPETADNIE